MDVFVLVTDFETGKSAVHAVYTALADAMEGVAILRKQGWHDVEIRPSPLDFPLDQLEQQA